MLVWLDRHPAELWLAQQPELRSTGALLKVAVQSFLSPGHPSADNWLPNVAPWTAVPGLLLFLELLVIAGCVIACARGKVKPQWASGIFLALTLLDLLLLEGSNVTVLGDASFWQYDPDVINLVRERAGTSRADVLYTKQWPDIFSSDPRRPPTSRLLADARHSWDVRRRQSYTVLRRQPHR